MIMKRYLLGILMLLALLQPWATRAWANHTIAKPNSAAVEQLNATHSENPATIIDNAVIEAEDEDEFSEIAPINSGLDVLIQQNDFCACAVLNDKSSSIRGIGLSDSPSPQPLYVLWSVFRI